MYNNHLSEKERPRMRFFFIFTTSLSILLFSGGLLVYYNQQSMMHVADERLNLYENTLKLQLSKYGYLPFLVAGSSSVKELLAGGGDNVQVNRFLKDANSKAGSTAVYVLDSKGFVLCSSNWDQDNSYVGLDLSFRPYFKAAIKGKGKTFYGVGFATEQPGYYISYPVVFGGVVKGVAVVKIDLSQLQDIWMDGGETLFVTDSNGIIILSSRPSWRYRTLNPLSDETLRVIQEGGQFPEPRLQRFQFKQVSVLLNLVTVDGDFFLESSRYIKGIDWEIRYLAGVKPLLVRTLVALLILMAFGVVAVLVRMFFRERHLKNISRQQAKEARKIQAINIKLAQEVQERERTESELRAAQNELIEAGKLAVVGEMATAVAHELNQPIAALKMYVASCRLMLKQDKTAELDPTLLNVLDISDRMAKVTEQLKSYARRSSDREFEFDLRDALDATLTLMQHQFALEACEIKLDIPDSSIPVLGDIGRFEQVLINLFRNALDAMQGIDGKLITVGMFSEGPEAVLSVLDNGPGIDSEVGSRVFEPFVTTKKEGVGLGLGLSISYKIIKEMGGSLQAVNCPDGGAQFFMRLPIYHSPEGLND